MDKTPLNKERVAVYIDGSNFYGYLHDGAVSWPKGVKFDYARLVSYLVGNGRACMSKRYYVGIARNTDGTQKSEQIVRGQQKFLAHLENDGFAIKRGRVIYDRGPIREKGTDVRLAIDLVVGAVDDLYDTAVIVSSDTDLIPAIKYIRFKGKRVEYVGFSHFPSLGIQKYADLSTLLSNKDIEQFKEAVLIAP